MTKRAEELLSHISYLFFITKKKKKEKKKKQQILKRVKNK